MTGPVAWQADGTPRSTRFDDIYRSAGTGGQGGWAQARQVFLGGCGLLPGAETAAPALWARQGMWHVLETGFGLGLNFLATWQAWQDDPQRPDRLFFTSVEAWPVTADDIRRSAEPFPALQPLADELASLWVAMTPGVHRLSLGQGRVHLTLLIGLAQDQLPTLDTPVNSVFLDGFDPAENPDIWDASTLKAVARLCEPGTRLATWTVARPVRDALTTLGFAVRKAAGLPPKRHRLEATYQPHWPLRRVLRLPLHTDRTAADVVVVGAGLSGAAVAHSLAQRGCRVQVLDTAPHPAAGASGLPVGLLAPHVSPDDNPLARLTRAGVRATRQRLQALLPAGQDWGATGALEHRVEGKHGLPPAALWPETARLFSRTADAAALQAAGLAPDTPALWHGLAAWLRPARLVQAQLNHPLIRWQGGATVTGLEQAADGWRVIGQQGQVWAQAPTVVLATAWPTRALLAALGLTLPLHALRGQVSWGALADLPESVRGQLPPFPVNGHGSLLTGASGPDGRPCWVVGSTFERGATTPTLREADHAANLERLGRLLPSLTAPMAPAFAHAQGWAGVRCTVPDRLPVVGAPDPQRWPGLQVCAGMGARGLTLSVLCGEVLAAELLGEPWPVARSLAAPLLAQRWAQRPQAAGA